MGKKKGNAAIKEKPKRLTEKNIDRPASPARSLIREIQYLPDNSMTIEQVKECLRAAMSRCLAGEEALYQAMVEEAEGWKMRLEELANDDGHEEDEEDMAKQRFKGQHAKTIEKWLRELFDPDGRVIVLEKEPDTVIYAIVIHPTFEGDSEEQRDTWVQLRLREDFPRTPDNVLGSLYHLTLLTPKELATLRQVLQFFHDEDIEFKNTARLLGHIAGIETWRKGFRHDL